MLSNGRARPFPSLSGVSDRCRALFIVSLFVRAAGYSAFHYDLEVFSCGMAELPPQRIARGATLLGYKLH